MLMTNNDYIEKEERYFKTTMFDCLEKLVYYSSSVSFQFDLIKDFIEENCGLSDYIIDTLDLSQERIKQLVSDLDIIFDSFEIVRL